MNAKTMGNQKGFHHIALLLLIVIVAVVGLVGYRVFKASGPKNSQSMQLPCCAKIPFKYSVGGDGRMYAIVNDQQFLTEFGAWGAHSQPHAGGHMEGNNKSNFRIYIQPKGKLVEMTGTATDPISGQTSSLTGGNGNGLCDPSEMCGVTAEDAQTNAPWYTAENDGMQLVAIERNSNQNLSPYIPGEDKQWRLYFNFAGLQLALQHIGQISPELVQKIKASGQESVLATTSYVDLKKPIDVPLGTRLARSQIIGNPSVVVQGKTIYKAEAQTEWTVTETRKDDPGEACQWNFFSQGDQRQLQQVLDIELTKPTPFGFFIGGSPMSNKVGVEAASEGTLCASDSIKFNDFQQISSNNSFGWYEITGDNHATGDIFAIYPVHTDSAIYRSVKSDYASGAVHFMFRRGPDTAGFADTSHYAITLKQGPKTYTMHEISGQVMDLTPTSDNPANDHLIIRVDRGDSGANSGTMPVGKFLGLRYHLDKDKMLVRWSELADTADTVVLPDPISTGAACNSQTTSCYIHDFSLLKRN